MFETDDDPEGHEVGLARLLGDRAPENDYKYRLLLRQYTQQALEFENRAQETDDEEVRLQLLVKRDEYLKWSQGIREAHENFRAWEAAHHGRLFNHIDQPRGEDPERKAAWDVLHPPLKKIENII